MTLALGIVTAIVGIVAILYPEMSLNILLIVFGVIIAASGLSGVIMYIRKDNKAMAMSLLDLVIGIVLIVVPSFMAEIGAILFGLTLVIMGIQFALDMGLDIAASNKVVSVVLGVVFVVLGLFMVFYPDVTVKVGMWVIGATFVIMGLSWIVQGWRFRSIA